MWYPSKFAICIARCRLVTLVRRPYQVRVNLPAPYKASSMLESPNLCAVGRRGTPYIARVDIGINCCLVVWPHAVVNNHLVNLLGSLSGCLLLVLLASST